VTECKLKSLNLQGAQPKYITQNARLHSILHELHQKHNHGEDVQADIDKYLPLLCLEAQNSVLLCKRPWPSFVLQKTEVMHVRMLPDLGALVREILVSSNSMPVSAMSKIMQYSMPFIKHNRMSFPVCESLQLNQLQKIIQVVLYSMLGLIPRTCKRNKQPLFRNRVEIFYSLWSLMLESNKTSMHNFCHNNVNIVRLALMEYFLFFLKKNMPIECSVLCHMFNLDLQIDDVCENLLDLVDTFRQTALSTAEFEWPHADTVAQALNERCNRMCKGKCKVPCKTVLDAVGKPQEAVHNISSSISEATLRLAMQLPQNQIYNISPDTGNISTVLTTLTTLTALTTGSTMPLRNTIISQNVSAVQKRILLYAMPYTMHLQQLESLRVAIKEQSMATSKIFWMYHCLRCDITDRDGIDRRMRLGREGSIYCSKCLQAEFVVSINTLGRFVKIKQKTYVFCTICMKVHAWNKTCDKQRSLVQCASSETTRQSNGKQITTDTVNVKASSKLTKATEPIEPIEPTEPTEQLVATEATDAIESTLKFSPFAVAMCEERCVLCTRTLNLRRVCILNVKKAFLFDVYLCPRHTPLQNAMSMINTIDDLVHAIKNKREHVSHFIQRPR